MTSERDVTRLLVFTTLFPHPNAPHHGIFVLERLRHWLNSSGAGGGREATVIAPVPYVPTALARGSYRTYRDIPEVERREGIEVHHPRYLLLPKVSMNVAPLLLADAGTRCALRLAREGRRFDLVDAHYLYPDGVAAAFLAKRLKLPLVVTARGTDVNLIPRHAVPRLWLRWLLRRADAAIAVSEALRKDVLALAPPSLECVTLRNGVDLAKFEPHPMQEARLALGWPSDRKIVLSVGHLIERKGHHHLLSALPLLPADVVVKIAGDGPWRGKLEAQAEALGVTSRVSFLGLLSHAELARAYSAANVLALLSSREGWANVLLESMACGTPVVATRVYGAPEAVQRPEAGRLVGSPSPGEVSAALLELLARTPDRAAVRAYAEGFSWTLTTNGMQELFERVSSQRAAS